MFARALKAGFESRRLFERFAMNVHPRRMLRAAVVVLALLTPIAVLAHDVTLQPVDTTGLDPLGADWRSENPYRGNDAAVKIGASGYNQNCARCHGLEAISGGIAPDLRSLEKTKSGDEWFLSRVRRGATINGDYKMPPFESLLSQEAMWAIRTYVESRPSE
jgi:cytochrome c-550 PedF